MKRIIYFIAALVIIAATVLLLISNKEKTDDRVYHFNKEKQKNIQVKAIKQENMTAEILYTGSFVPEKESKIGAEVPGIIKGIWVDIGSHVRAGQKLIQIDTSMLHLQLQSVSVQIEGLEADIQRYTVLVKADAIQGVQLEKTELALKSAMVQKAVIEEQIKKSIIAAPFSGIVTAKLTEIGSFAAPGQPLLQITDISRLKFTINVPESELDGFTPGLLTELKSDAYPEIKLKGKLLLINSKSNPGNTFTIQFSAANTSDQKIKAGMFGSVSFRKAMGETGIIIPASSIIGSDTDPKVYKVNNGKAVLQNIEIVRRFDDKAVIKNGLREGDILVTNGFINLFDGANVKYEVR